MKQQSKGKVLITGGAGFIGSHTADELDNSGYEIRILDNLDPKTHFGKFPNYLKKHYEKVKGDVRDKKTLYKSLQGVNYVIHLAAQMDLTPDFSKFFDTNVTSTAQIYELIVEHNLPIKKVVVASSQFVYGEGKSQCNKHKIVYPHLRTPDKLEKGIWEPLCPICNKPVIDELNTEEHQDPPNQYAISKYAQELIALKIGQNYQIPSVAMRYSIVHGPRQSIKNAYSGALRIFALQMLDGKTPTIFEDGNSLRDYVSVYDVAKANKIVLENNKADYENFNVGGGKGYTVMELAKMVADNLGLDLTLKPSNEFRVGDIRHAVSNTSKLQKLGWKPKTTEKEIVKDYLTWLKTQNTKTSAYSKAIDEMRSKNVIRKTK